MSHPLVRTRTRPTPYKVGYGKPPKSTQFKKGGPGGPGRPKGSTSLLGDLEKLMQQKIVATVNGRRRTISQREALLRRLFEQALKGHLPSLNLLFKLQAMQPLDAETSAAQAPPAQPLTADEKSLLRDHLARIKARNTEVAP